MNQMIKNFKKEVNKEHSGAVAVEYILILVIMAVVIVFAWNLLGDTIRAKVRQIAKFIRTGDKDIIL